MITDRELKKEREYLKAVLYLLEKEIEKNTSKVDEYTESIKENLKYTWDYDNQIDINEWATNMMNVELKSLTAINSTDRIKSYTRMLKNAYFARFDFETEGDVIPVYMGIATLSDGTDFYIYDWRAPISGMFYDYEMGNAEYTTPDGNIIKGKIILKRQYKIEGDKIVQIFDTDMQVIDSILKQMLSSKASDKMKNIVNTIQKEQNKVIRKKGVDLLVVQGPAGSGKTSVAMHKIAYLLYTERKNINNSNVLIISPNDIFSNYISSVLPEIGEDNVYQTTFMDFVRGQLDFKIKGSNNEMFETIYTEPINSRKHSLEFNSIMLKYGATYINLLENFIALKRNDILGIDDIKVDDKILIDKEYLEKLASELESNGVSLVNQGKKLIEKIILHLAIKQGGKQTSAAAKIKKTLEANLDKLKVKSLFVDLYSDKNRFVSMIEEIYNTTGTPAQNRLSIKELSDIFEYNQSLISKNTLPFEDVVGYLYLKDRIQGSANQSKIKYVLIDEAQDYTIMQYKILSHLFKRSNITILGDLNQSIMPFASHQNYESIINVLKLDRPGIKYDMNYLTKTYRSTYEINMFSKHIIGDTNMYNQVDRHGDEVSIIKDSNGEKSSKVFSDALELKKYYNTVAIITKTQREANALKEALDSIKKNNTFKVVTGKDKVFNGDKILIIPSYLAKGLEFDAVLVYNASEKEYPKEYKNLLYVVCTRALHKLNIYYKDTLSSLIKIK